MNKTQAAEIIATDMRVFARTHGLELTKDLAEARVSEHRGAASYGTLKHRAAVSANPNTVLRLARAAGEL